MPASGPGAKTPLRLPGSYDALLLDLDGVVIRGPQAVPGAVEAVRLVASHGLAVVFVTNNAARTPEAVSQQLRGLGIEATSSQVLTSAMVAADALAQTCPPGSAVLVVGGAGLHAAVRGVGLRPVVAATKDAVAVVQGFGTDVGWRLLAEASYAVARGATWIATNADRTVPTDRGLAPGTGAFIDAVTQATGRRPLVTGKPAPALHQAAARRAGGRQPLVVGDRLDTDIAGAVAAGLSSALVLTGVTTVGDVAGSSGTAGPLDPQPTWIADSLWSLVTGGAR